MEPKTVLVIEDNPMNMKLVKTLLRVDGYNILEAEEATSGIDLARSQNPDLILMDIQLPGMDGLEATRLIKADSALQGIPVIAISAHAMEGDAQSALDAGCDAYITKPLDTRKFLTTVKASLEHNTGPGTDEAKSTRLFRPKILIVDDVQVNVKLLASKLPKSKYELLTAYGGQEAIDTALREAPDLILLDYMMPVMDGLEVTRRLRADDRTKEIPIIIVTALDGTEEKLGILEAGAEEFLNKPVNATELLARVQSLLLMKQYRDQLRIRKESTEFFVLPGAREVQERAEEKFSKILIVEDGDRDARLIQSYLQALPVQTFHVKSAREALDFIEQNPMDLVLLDVMLPGMDGFEVCRRLRENEDRKHIQIVMVTCLSDLESRIRGIELGVDDYLIKPIQSRELIARLKTLLRKKTYLDQLHTNLETAVNTAILDGLTGLYNHGYFQRFLELEIKRSQRHGYPVALFMIDVDNFKECNDRYGHLAGDRILVELAQVIRRGIRETDLAARYGGEEFAVVLPYCDSEHAMAIGDRMRKLIETHPFRDTVEPFQGSLTVSVGISVSPVDGADHTGLIEKADQRLYRAKGEGKNRVCFCAAEVISS